MPNIDMNRETYRKRIQFSLILIIEINEYSRWLNAISVDIPTESSKNSFEIRLKIKLKPKFPQNKTISK